MAIGDTVTISTDTNLSEVPPFGVVSAEPGGTDALVLWRNGELTQVPQTQLQKVFPATAAVNIVGQWMQLVAFPERDAGLDPTAKSPATAGLVVDAYGIGNYDAQAADTEWAILSTEDGRSFWTTFFDPGDPDMENPLVFQDRERV